mgnify:CR=1 FL=1
MDTSKISPEGALKIPEHIRQKLKSDTVSFQLLEGGKVLIEPVQDEKTELMSEEEHQRLLNLLDSVRELVPENIPITNAQEHDAYLYSQP